MAQQMHQRCYENGFAFGKAACEATIAAARAEAEQLRQEGAGHAAEAAAARGRVAMMECEIETTKDELTKARAALEDMRTGAYRRAKRALEEQHRAELRANTEAAKQHDAQAEVARAKAATAESELQNARNLIGAMRLRAEEQQLQAEQQRQLQAEAAQQLVAAAAAKVDSLQKAHGHAKAELERLREAEAKRAAASGSDATHRQRLAALTKEVGAARVTVSEQQEKIASLEARLEIPPRRAAPAEATAKLISPRTSASPNAPLSARTMEYMRALVEECDPQGRFATEAVDALLV